VSRWLTAVADRAEWIGYRVLGGLLAGMSVVIAWQVFQRKVVGVTHAWTEEGARYAMIWLGLVGAALGLRRGSHIAVEYFAGKMSRNRLVGRAIAAAVWVAEVAFALFLVVCGWRLATALMGESSPGTGLPVGVVDLALPVGGGLMILFLAEQAVAAWSRRRS